ncbi:MAG TPA: alkaline phosphatase PhoX, partial [Solirubrobacteraceae bacterium]|nr:alkaline phosphatase PhoX [Solirubrobacteraceae bacterium]
MTIDFDASEGLSRRGMLSRSAAGLGIALSGSVGGLFGTGSSAAVAHGHHRRHDIGYGPLIDDPDGLLSLPKGFDYKIVAQSGVTTLETGEPTPSDPDGTAAFVRKGGNGSVLINNHEISGSEPFPVPHVAGYVYDETAPGGTTNIEVDRHGNRIREYVSLAGTHTNCAGGRTP